MKPKTLMLLAVAGGCGLVAMLMVQQAMSGNKGPAKVETARVLVAVEQIDSGMRLTETNVVFKDVAIDSIPEGDIITSIEQWEERAPQVPLMPGDIIRMSKLTEKGGWGRSIAIPMGMRVATISVNDEHTNSGLLSPGDRVDVLVTFKGKGSNSSIVSKTKTLLEYIEVFATDAKTATKLENGKESGKAKAVSLLLSPEQVTFIRLAENKGTLSLSWRHRLDDELVQTKDVDGDLLEELSGSYGGNDMFDRPNYDQHAMHELPEHEPEFGHEPDPIEEEKPSTSEFLDSVDETESFPAPVAVVQEQAPAKPQWTLEVYNGNNPIVQQFEIPEEPVEEVEEETTPAAEQASIADTVRWLWPAGKSKSENSASSTELDTEEERSRVQ